MRSSGKVLVALAAATMCLPLALAQDNIEGPWGTANGNLFATQPAPMALPGAWRGTIQKAWEFDVAANGLDRTAFQVGQITFDAAGNIYWGAKNGKLGSVDPNGVLRFATTLVPSNDIRGVSPVVGHNAVYILSGINATPTLGAYSKTNGARAWETAVPLPTLGGLNPVLYNGKLYVVSMGGAGLGVTRFDAASGQVDWSNVVEPNVTGPATDGTVTCVPDLFGSGQHGLFLNRDAGNNTLPAAFGINVGPASAALAWEQPCGKVARSHMPYSPVTGMVYAHTWSDYGDAFRAFNALTGAIVTRIANTAAQGFYDVAALEADGKTLVVGGSFPWNVRIYSDDGTGHVNPVQKIFKCDFPDWVGEPRSFGQLFPADAQGGPYLLSGTNSHTDLNAQWFARVVLLDMNRAQTPSTNDGPCYIDNIELYEGTDYASAIGAGPVFAENFQTGFNQVPGRVDQKSTWTDISGAEGGFATVVNDPTGGGHGIVMKLDPNGNQYLADQNQGAEVTLPRAIPNLPTKTYAVIRWQQWRADLYDNVTAGSPVFHDANGYTTAHSGVFEWDGAGDPNSQNMYTYETGSESILMHAGAWQQVELRCDFTFNAVDLYLDGVLAAGVPDFLFDPQTPFLTWAFTMDPTPPVANDGIVPQPTLAQYLTDIDSTNGVTLRGGPLMGPDGKVYYLRTTTPTNLVALKASACPGDCNCDGRVDFGDINPFVLALSDFNAWRTQFPNCPVANPDVNGDGHVDFGDINPFVALLSGGGGPCH